MSGHTPGPWTQGVADGMRHWVNLPGKARGINAGSIANASLIAASPDGLLAGSELLEVVQAAIANGDWKVDGRCDPDMAIHRMQAFIAKATGAQP